MRTRSGVILAVVLMAGCTAESSGAPPGPPPSAAAGSSVAAAAPALDVTVVVDGLDHAWDVAQARDGTLLVDERSGGFTAVLPDGTVREVHADFDDLFARGETGLMGLVLDSPRMREQARTALARAGTLRSSLDSWRSPDGARAALAQARLVKRFMRSSPDRSRRRGG